jgi:SAM-dependent methyltransferase
LSNDISICILCASNQLVELTCRKGLRVLKCRKCGLLIGNNTSPSQSENFGAIETDPNHFTMLKDDYAKLATIMDQLFSKRIKIIENLLGSTAKNWLEIGPGNGLMSDILSKRGAYWLGVEIDGDMASFMQADGKNVIHADFSEVAVEAIIPEHVKDAGGFDAIFFSQVFEHVTAPANFLDNAITCLRPKGVIYVDVPNNMGLTAWLRKLNPLAGGYGEIVPPHHMIAYSPDTLTFALEQAGFKDISSFGRTYNDPIFGLAHAHLWNDKKLKLAWAAAKALGMGGNLIAMAKKP